MKTKVATFLLIAYSSILAVNCGENWFTKSLDNYGFSNCTPLDHSNVIGDFHACQSGSAGSSGSQGSWWPQPSEGEDGLNESETSDGQESWPESEVGDLDLLLSCFPAFFKLDCLTPEEIEFFQIAEQFFRLRRDFFANNSSGVAEAIANTSCSKVNQVDSEQMCFSQITSRFSWFNWQVNWEDGQMCSLITKLRDCDLKGYSECPDVVKNFISGSWDSGLEATNCAQIIAESTTQPTGSTEFYSKFIDNEYNYNANGAQNSQYNPMEKSDSPFSKYIPKF
ncbi:hypothetical protein HDE_05925 [Halotydeus destructor]|nr:hypothetical protein HDE_05925 [Halotydeus destructor]